MRKIDNKVMLITYADSMGGDLKKLYDVLDKHFQGVVEGVHILPFFPSSGDRGFAVINYDMVDPAFGDWEDIKKFGERYFLMCDFMLNHISIRSEEFQDYMKNGDASPYRDMFIHWEEFWPKGEPTEEELKALYLRRGVGPVKEFTRADGKVVRLWNTFFSEQVDIDPTKQPTKDYYNRNLTRLAQYVPAIRFDAFAYASKRPGSSCFFVEPEVWDVLETGMAPLRPFGTEMLPEIHENYKIQMKMAEKGYPVYDFAIPLLLIHAVYSGRTDRLSHWLNICPRKQYTTLDTHDGIGVVDAQYLLEEDELDFACDKVGEAMRDVRRQIGAPEGSSRSVGGKKQRYQLHGTYFDALGRDEEAYLLCRAVQFFTPGIPQVYYVGMLAGESDTASYREGESTRSLNRHNYTLEEIDREVERPIVRRLMELCRFRNTCPAFDGEILPVEESGGNQLNVTWRNGGCTATLHADFGTKRFTVEVNGETLTF